MNKNVSLPIFGQNLYQDCNHFSCWGFIPKLYNEPGKIGMKIFGLKSGEMLKFAAFVINSGSEVVMKTEPGFHIFLVYLYLKSRLHVDSRFQDF